MTKQNNSQWLEVPSVTPGGKPFFYVLPKQWVAFVNNETIDAGIDLEAAKQIVSK